MRLTHISSRRPRRINDNFPQRRPPIRTAFGPASRTNSNLSMTGIEAWSVTPLEQPEPGVLIWHTPAGRTYTTTPTEYWA